MSWIVHRDSPALLVFRREPRGIRGFACLTVARGFLLCGMLASCGPPDIGKDCPGMELPEQGGVSTEGDVLRTQGNEIVEYHIDFPCSSMVCIATLGRGAYCSDLCFQDSDCPPAFECRVVMDFGPFAGQSYCTWKTCTVDANCGNIDWYACRPAEALSLTEEVKLCSMAD